MRASDRDRWRRRAEKRAAQRAFCGPVATWRRRACDRAYYTLGAGELRETSERRAKEKEHDGKTIEDMCATRRSHGESDGWQVVEVIFCVNCVEVILLDKQIIIVCYFFSYANMLLF